MALEHNISIDHQKLYRTALGLAVFTILYNLIEGVISVFFGFQDEYLSLFGFGSDSFIEVISGIGIAHMILRIRKHPGSPIDSFEKTALQITGVCFYVLVLMLVSTALYNLYIGHQPETTLVGIIVSIVSIIVMLGLVTWKKKVGRKLNSDPILADANCTMVCIYMSFILLGSSLIYEFSGIAFIDSLGALGLSWFAFKEGKECFEKAQGKACCDHS